MFCDKIFFRLTLFSIFIAWDVLGKFSTFCTVEERIVRDLNNMQTSRLCCFTKQGRKTSFECYFSGILGLFFL